LHTWCGLSANLRCRSETCCTGLAANTGRKKSSKNRHLGTIAEVCLGSVTARHSNIERQPNFAALNRGRHLYSAGRPSRWALAHILVLYLLHIRHTPIQTLLHSSSVDSLQVRPIYACSVNDCNIYSPTSLVARQFIQPPTITPAVAVCLLKAEDC